MVFAENYRVIDLTHGDSSQLYSPVPESRVTEQLSSDESTTLVPQMTFNPERLTYQVGASSRKLSLFSMPDSIAGVLAGNPNSARSFSKYQSAMHSCVWSGMVAGVGALFALVSTEDRLTGKKILKTDANNMVVVENGQLVYVDEHELVLGQAGQIGLGLSALGAVISLVSYGNAKNNLVQSLDEYMQGTKRPRISLQWNLVQPKMALAYSF